MLKTMFEQNNLAVIEKACREIINELILEPNIDRVKVNSIKADICRTFALNRVPSNAEILSYVLPEERDTLLPILKKRPTRTSSGIAIVAVMAKPFRCPHVKEGGPCLYCPGGPESIFGDVPQSYTGDEPAAMRAIQNNFDPYKQVKNRLGQLQAIGHPCDKIHLIIMGGTFPAVPFNYQKWFVHQCLNAIANVRTHTFEEAKHAAERSALKNTGITVETRPDYSGREHVDRMLELGVTCVELGVQTIYDEIFEIVRRGHKVAHVIDATKTLKDAGLKVTMHLMPGLPGSSPEKDLDTFRAIFNDPQFRPDALKIYPCLVLKGTGLYQMWKRGKYRPYPTEDVIELLTKMKKIIPEWIRIQRIQRDIPANLIVDGVKKGNLRELVQKKIEEIGYNCKCIRCREAGHVKQKFGIDPDLENIKFCINQYHASDGTELFLSYRDVKKDILIGFLRLRIPSEKAHRPEINNFSTAIVRELHVYGPLVKVNAKPKIGEWQHKGYGKRLMKKAEQIAMEQFNCNKVVVISGIGVKEYYFKLGYKRDGPYVSKKLNDI